MALKQADIDKMAKDLKAFTETETAEVLAAIESANVDTAALEAAIEAVQDIHTAATEPQPEPTPEPTPESGR